MSKHYLKAMFVNVAILGMFLFFGENFYGLCYIAHAYARNLKDKYLYEQMSKMFFKNDTRSIILTISV